MADILEISNWDQLVDAKSDFTNLKIKVRNYNNDKLVGTQIIIADYNTNAIYFSAFATILQSTVIPTSAKLTNEEMIAAINSFGFNVRISEPYILAPDVVEILQGLLSAGYQYVYRDYPMGAKYLRYGIYATDQLKMRMTDLYLPSMPDFVENEWDWCKPNTTYPIANMVETGTVNNGLPIEF